MQIVFKKSIIGLFLYGNTDFPLFPALFIPDHKLSRRGVDAGDVGTVQLREALIEGALFPVVSSHVIGGKEHPAEKGVDGCQRLPLLLAEPDIV